MIDKNNSTDYSFKILASVAELPKEEKIEKKKK
jgi:hypothetical protein